MHFVFCILSAYCRTPITQDSVFQLTNQARQEQALRTLQENPKLDLAAQRKADDMVNNAYFSHISPDGKTPWDFIHLAHYDYKAAGENLAIGFNNAEEEQQAWFDSRAHRANELRRIFTQTGIGIAKFGNDTLVVQLFAEPKH